ncbi:hypothetical protein [Gemmatimonas sp.]|uniref:hypothetical protein n=1 Tax=Gemmatimonas sp. TaxID=1962908 RepID=UPI003564E74D
MLPYGNGCTPDGEVVCSSIFTVGESILNVALTAINGYPYADACDAPMVEGVVTIGRAVGYEPDMVTVALQNFGPSPRSRDDRGNLPNRVMWRATWQIQLVESGWLTFLEAGDDEIVMAPSELIHANAAYSYSHAEMMYRALASAVLGRNIPGACEDNGCFADLGDLVPIDPDGHTVGWETSCSVEIDISKSCS